MQHEKEVYSAQFSPDGQQVLTASEDGTARLWDVPAISSPASPEDVLLLADLAEATAGPENDEVKRLRGEVVRLLQLPSK